MRSGASVLKALRLDDDMDPVGVLIEIEGAFDIKVSDVEAESISTVGQMYDLLRKRVHWSDANRKMRERDGLLSAPARLDRSRGGDRTTTVIGFVAAAWRLQKVICKVARGEIRFALAASQRGFCGAGRRGTFVTASFGGLAMLVASWFLPLFSNTLLIAAAGLFLGGIAAGVMLLQKDAGRLPRRYRTLGVSLKGTANMNYGRLVKQGAAASDDRIWEVLVKIISDFSGDPADQIARETYFLQSTLNNKSTAA